MSGVEIDDQPNPKKTGRSLPGFSYNIRIYMFTLFCNCGKIEAWSQIFLNESFLLIGMKAKNDSRSYWQTACLSVGLCANAGQIYFDRSEGVERKVVKKPPLF